MQAQAKWTHSLIVVDGEIHQRRQDAGDVARRVESPEKHFVRPTDIA
jgi:hypothetical protein